MNRTKIEYLDYTLNIMPGCAGVGCAVKAACWARGQLKRKKPYVDAKGVSRGCQLCYDFVPHVHVERFEEPIHVKRPSRIGLNFTGDTFDAWWVATNHFGKYTSEDGKLQLKKLFEMCRLAPWHTFIILTKQPQNIPADLEFPPNVWLGVSVNRRADLWRLDELRKRNVKLRFVSFEPLYEDIGAVDLSGIQWVIIGAQTRPNMQPKREWVDNLLFRAYEQGVKVFLKNNLVFELDDPAAERLRELPEQLCITPFEKQNHCLEVHGK